MFIFMNEKKKKIKRNKPLGNSASMYTLPTSHSSSEIVVLSFISARFRKKKKIKKITPKHEDFSEYINFIIQLHIMEYKWVKQTSRCKYRSQITSLDQFNRLPMIPLNQNQ